MMKGEFTHDSLMVGWERTRNSRGELHRSVWELRPHCPLLATAWTTAQRWPRSSSDFFFFFFFKFYDCTMAYRSFWPGDWIGAKATPYVLPWTTPDPLILASTVTQDAAVNSWFTVPQQELQDDFSFILCKHFFPHFLKVLLTYSWSKRLW